jgi:hypothetical protein
VLDQDETGARWTQVTRDVQGIRSVQSIWNTGIECGYEPPPETVTATLPGWPVNCALSAAGLPRPHDPPGAIRSQEWREQVPRRRAVADGIANELADTGHQDAAQYAEAQRWRALEMGDTDLGPVPPRLIDLRDPLGPGDPAQAVADRALSEAWKLAAAGNPPPGSVRARKSWPSGRPGATGPWWPAPARRPCWSSSRTTFRAGCSTSAPPIRRAHSWTPSPPLRAAQRVARSVDTATGINRQPPAAKQTSWPFRSNASGPADADDLLWLTRRRCRRPC